MMKSPSFRIFVLLSLVFHILFVGAFLIIEKFFPQQPKTEVVTIDFISPESLQELATIEEKLKQKTLQAKNQVVEQNENTANESVPENARFLSAKNQAVNKQTVAANRGEFQNLKKEGPQGVAAKTAPREKSRKEITKDLFKSFSASDSLIRQKSAQKNEPLSESESQEALNSGAGAETSQTNDYIKDVDTGLETMLNTREFKYYSYYNRIRKQLSQHWEGRVREKLSRLFREGRAPAATNRDRITKLMIILNDKGTLVGVQIIGDSGVRDLDDAAVEAFRAAAPFPNPPKGIVEGDGTVKIRWDFVLET